MSRLQPPSQLLRAVSRASTSPAASFPLRAAAFSQTCRLPADEGSSSSSSSNSSNAAPSTPADGAPSPLPEPSLPFIRPTPPRISSIFAPTPSAAQPASAASQAPSPMSMPPPGVSPLPRTANWHAAQADRISTPMPQLAQMTAGSAGMGALLKSAVGRGFSGDPDKVLSLREEPREPFHLHVFAHRHNTHVTLTRPNRDPILSVSCGNLGFKKSKRKHYDAAYQLTQHVLQVIEKKQLLDHIHSLEVVLRGFGQGREAAAKVLLSSEGAEIKKKIVRVSDATRIKFGGTRSKNPRRI